MSSIERQIFQKGSTTYYFSSQFFPKNIRQDVFKLYSFVRIADDYVDSSPPQADRFYALRAAWDKAKHDAAFNFQPSALDPIEERVVKNIIQLTHKYNFNPAWIDSFLGAMQSDVQGRTLYTLDDTLKYVYGSSEVVGLMMARIMGLPMCNCHAAESALLALPDRAHPDGTIGAPLRASVPPSISSLQASCQVTITSRLQGRAMQWLNFVRDIKEDNQLGRCYFPRDELHAYGLKSLEEPHDIEIKNAIAHFIWHQLDRYEQWQAEANQGFAYIPRRLRIPLQTAVDMHAWTAKRIAKDPLIVYRQKVRPQKSSVIARALARILYTRPST
jgi:phytoene synthase